MYRKIWLLVGVLLCCILVRMWGCVDGRNVGWVVVACVLNGGSSSQRKCSANVIVI